MPENNRTISIVDTIRHENTLISKQTWLSIKREQQQNEYY